MRIGITYDLKEDYKLSSEQSQGEAYHKPDDLYEELDSVDTVKAIGDALSNLGHNVSPVGGGRKAAKLLLETEVDMVFNIAEGFGTRSREAHIPSILEMLNIPYTGSDPLTLALSLDKGLTKRVVVGEGVTVPSSIVLREARELEELSHKHLTYPVIVKPLHEGSSIGVRRNSKVYDFGSLTETVSLLLDGYNSPCLVEEFIHGMEVTVGVIGNGKEGYCLGIMAVIPRSGSIYDFIYSFEVKRNWREEVEYIINPDLGTTLIERIKADAIKAFHALQCRDVARLDFRCDLKRGIPYFLEINPLPGLNPEYSDLPIMASRKGVPYESLISEILSSALKRYNLCDGRYYLQSA